MRIFASLLLPALLLCGCHSIYSPAMYQAAPTIAVPLKIPASKEGSGGSRWAEAFLFVSTDLARSRGPLAGERQYVARVHASTASDVAVGHSVSARAALGAFGYGGQFQHPGSGNQGDSAGHYSIYGGGAQMDLNMRLQSRGLSFGVGCYLGTALEFGTFQKLWLPKALPPILPFMGLYTFLDAELAPSLQATLQGAVQLPFGATLNAGITWDRIGIWGGVQMLHVVDEGPMNLAGGISYRIHDIRD